MDSGAVPMFKVNLYDKGNKHSAGAEQYQKLKIKELQSNFGSNRRGINPERLRSVQQGASQRAGDEGEVWAGKRTHDQ